MDLISASQACHVIELFEKFTTDKEESQGGDISSNEAYMDLLSVCYIGVAAVMHDVVMEGYNLSVTSISTLVQRCTALSSPNNTANSPQLRIAALVALSNCTYNRNTLRHNTHHNLTGPLLSDWCTTDYSAFRIFGLLGCV